MINVYYALYILLYALFVWKLLPSYKTILLQKSYYTFIRINILSTLLDGRISISGFTEQNDESWRATSKYSIMI